MKKVAGLLLAIIVVITLVTVVFLGVGATSYWETEASFGRWQTEIIIEFADGTSESLKIIEESLNPFAVVYDGKAITKVRWIISGVATGTGYDKAVVDRSNVQTGWRLSSGITTKTTGTFTSTGTVDLWIDGSAETINVGEVFIHDIMEYDLVKYPVGIYILKFTPSGTVRYWGEPNGGGDKFAELPPSRSLTLYMVRFPTGSISVTLSSDVTTT